MIFLLQLLIHTTFVQRSWQWRGYARKGKLNILDIDRTQSDWTNPEFRDNVSLESV